MKRIFPLFLLLIAIYSQPLKGENTEKQSALAKKYADVSANLVNSYLIPHYETFSKKTLLLYREAPKFCQDPSENNFKSLELAFHETVDQWMKMEHLRFGPVDKGLTLFRIYFWPDKRNVLSRQLGKAVTRGDISTYREDRFVDLTVALQGITALERLLFSDPYKKLLSAKKSIGSKEKNAICDYAILITRNLHLISLDLIQRWNVHRTLLVGKKTMQYSPKQGVAMFFQSLNDQLIKIQSQKIAPILGAKSAEKGTKRAEAYRSKRTLRNLKINLKALQIMLEQKNGLLDLLDNSGNKKSKGATLRVSISSNLSSSLKTLNSLPSGKTLISILKSKKTKTLLDELNQKILLLSQLVKGPFSQQIDIAIGFNSADGD